jgi:excisionase family DNA binding protein
MNEVTVVIQPTLILFRPVPALAEPENPALLDLARAAAYLGMKPRKLRDLCRENRITHSRPDYRTYRFLREDLDAYLKEYRMNRR